MATDLRTGIGYDAHPLKARRRLVLGGIEIPADRGADGWSDADALTHAVMDALLGAAALGDIGRHFPPGDPRYRDISSLVLLAEVKEKLAAAGWAVVNIDAVVTLKQPKLADYIEGMRRELGRVLGIGAERVGVKAGTANGLGFIGRGDGIAAYAVALIEGGQPKT